MMGPSLRTGGFVHKIDMCFEIDYNSVGMDLLKRNEISIVIVKGFISIIFR